MSRCTPNAGRWTSRTRRKGGLGAIAATRSTQFQALAQLAKAGTPAQKELVSHAVAFLEDNPIRTLSVESEIVLGIHVEPTEDETIEEES